MENTEAVKVTAEAVETVAEGVSTIEIPTENGKAILYIVGGAIAGIVVYEGATKVVIPKGKKAVRKAKRWIKKKFEKKPVEAKAETENAEPEKKAKK